MKLLLMMLYIIVAAIGAVFVSQRSQTSTFDYVAQVNLPRNHRLVATDLKEPDVAWALFPRIPPESLYTGRYVDGDIPAGEPVKPGRLKEEPSPAAMPGTRAHPWWLRKGEEHWLEMLDVGWTVDLCADDCPVTGAQVLALRCSTPGGTACAVVLQLTPDQSERLVEYPGKQKLNIEVNTIGFGGMK